MLLFKLKRAHDIKENGGNCFSFRHLDGADEKVRKASTFKTVETYYKEIGISFTPHEETENYTCWIANMPICDDGKCRQALWDKLNCEDTCPSKMLANWGPTAKCFFVQDGEGKDKRLVVIRPNQNVYNARRKEIQRSILRRDNLHHFSDTYECRFDEARTLALTQVNRIHEAMSPELNRVLISAGAWATFGDKPEEADYREAISLIGSNLPWVMTLRHYRVARETLLETYKSELIGKDPVTDRVFINLIKDESWLSEEYIKNFNRILEDVVNSTEFKASSLMNT